MTMLRRKSGAPYGEGGSLGSAHDAALARSARMTYQISVLRTLFFVFLAMLFASAVWRLQGQSKAMEFLTGYIIEESLSLDNLFAFYMLFDYFKVEVQNQEVVLFWGLLGAAVLRAISIFLGAWLVESLKSIVLLLAGLLCWSGSKMLLTSDAGGDSTDLSQNRLVLLVRRVLPVADSYDGTAMFVRRNGRLLASPLLLVLVVVEFTDVAFAVDSIPAVLGVSSDPLIIYSSNLFAILGLRSLYTLVANAAKDLPHLQKAVGLVLIFVGSKMVVEYFGQSISTSMSLGVVGGILSIGLLVSLYLKHRAPSASASALVHPLPLEDPEEEAPGTAIEMVKEPVTVLLPAMASPGKASAAHSPTTAGSTLSFRNSPRPSPRPGSSDLPPRTSKFSPSSNALTNL